MHSFNDSSRNSQGIPFEIFSGFLPVIPFSDVISGAPPGILPGYLPGFPLGILSLISLVRVPPGIFPRLLKKCKSQCASIFISGLFPVFLQGPGFPSGFSHGFLQVFFSDSLWVCFGDSSVDFASSIRDFSRILSVIPSELSDSLWNFSRDSFKVCSSDSFTNPFLDFARSSTPDLFREFSKHSSQN